MGPIHIDKEVYANFSEKIERFFANKTAEPGAVEDLMHDTFIRYFQRQAHPTNDVILNPGPFLMGIAKNVLLEYWRACNKRENADDIGDLSIADMSQGLPSRISRAEKLALIRELLRELPLNHQMVLELHYWQGASYKEIARLLQVALGTVASWGRQGRRSLEQKLALAWRDDIDRRDPSDELVEHNPLSAYVWYDQRTGGIDHLRLARAAMIGSRTDPPTSTPNWLIGLQLPPSLPEASPSELSEISKAAWHAWVDAGRPA